jgi:hypothetical protein
MISFYYVVGAGKPAPTVPSDQSFYQSLWEALDRSNRSLKRANTASATLAYHQPRRPRHHNQSRSKRLVRQDIMEKEKSTNGEYDVDVTKYFKLVSTDVDETIFEDE